MGAKNQIKQTATPDNFNYEVGKVFSEVRDYYLDYFGNIERQIKAKYPEKSEKIRPAERHINRKRSKS